MIIKWSSGCITRGMLQPRVSTIGNVRVYCSYFCNSFNYSISQIELIKSINFLFLMQVLQKKNGIKTAHQDGVMSQYILSKAKTNHPSIVWCTSCTIDWYKSSCSWPQKSFEIDWKDQSNRKRNQVQFVQCIKIVEFNLKWRWRKFWASFCWLHVHRAHQVCACA